MSYIFPPIFIHSVIVSYYQFHFLQSHSIGVLPLSADTFHITRHITSVFQFYTPEDDLEVEMLFGNNTTFEYLTDLL